jgi:hypothetical protein
MQEAAHNHAEGSNVKGTRTVGLIVVLVLLLIVAIIRFAPKHMMLNASAVSTTANVGVYWDANFQNNVSSISWGNLTLWDPAKVEVYARNEGNASFFLALLPENWNPVNVSQYLNFQWTSDNISVGVGMAVKVTITLSVAMSYVTAPTNGGLVSFSFNIVFEGLDHLLGDLNRDGVVNILDVNIVSAAYGSHGPNYDYPGEPASPNWNPVADLTNSNVVNAWDLAFVMSEYGEHS